MTMQERNKMRKLQDKLLALPQFSELESKFGGNYRFMPGAPTINELRSKIFPTWESEIRMVYDTMVRGERW